MLWVRVGAGRLAAKAANGSRGAEMGQGISGTTQRSQVGQMVGASNRVDEQVNAGSAALGRARGQGQRRTLVIIGPCSAGVGSPEEDARQNWRDMTCGNFAPKAFLGRRRLIG